MSFKKFSSAHNTPRKDGSADQSKEAAAAEKPIPQPGQKPADAAPATKR